ncbi:hypothetical protein PHYPSEUDO_006197 [Phytophthora pseudosyringae]|uniref:Uncharacterized protein n=1 Tax=Phytophthora pseudosyringae TaxID=221518 RepID=A0A8T1VJH9_9STRA|nr:hypothetical protein PHYPSEUDO_006197 [Phytophthora pseudosyringae]
MGREVLSWMREEKDTIEQRIVLIIIAAALAKYGEQTLVCKDNLGEMDGLVSTHFRTHGLRSDKQQEYRKTHNFPHSHKKHVAHTVGLGFVLELALRLPPEKRVGCEELNDILNHSSNMRLVLTATNLGLYKDVNEALKSPTTSGKTSKWARLERDRLQPIVKQVQSDGFQEAMIEAGGEHVYDAIRARLNQADATLWDDGKDKITLRHVNIQARERRAQKNKAEKDAERRKKLQFDETGRPLEKKTQGKAKKKRAHKTSQGPPPAPAGVNASKTAKSARNSTRSTKP